MARSFPRLVIAAAALVALLLAPARTQSASTLAGIWALNRSLSELPREIGFTADWISAPSAAPLGMICISLAVGMDQTPYRKITPFLCVVITTTITFRNHPRCRAACLAREV